jgi:hypothetical protein
MQDIREHLRQLDATEERVGRIISKHRQTSPKKESRPVYESMREIRNQQKRFTNEHFKIDDFKNKVKCDYALFEQLLKPMYGNQGATDLINDSIENLYSIAQAIYENTNSTPKSLVKVDATDSEDDIERKTKKVVNTFLETYLYNVPNQRLKERYGDKIIQTLMENVTSDSISEDNIEEAISVCYKYLILEEMLNTIVFPERMYERAKYVLAESDDLSAADVKNYNNLFTLFDKNISRAANTIALFV